jgi:hypothetical protein
MPNTVAEKSSRARSAGWPRSFAADGFGKDKGFVYNYPPGIKTTKTRRKPNDIRVVNSWENMKKFAWALTRNGEGT